MTNLKKSQILNISFKFWRKSIKFSIKFVNFLLKINKTKNTFLSVFGRLAAHFSTNLNLKDKISLYRPTADFGLIFRQI